MPPGDGGRKLGAYRLLSQIAVGGMAEIYEAVQSGVSGFEKKLALKVIHPNYSEDPDFVRMLIDEAKLAVQLQHANIVQTYDLGKIDEQYYIAMELVDGVDVYRLLRRASEHDLDFPFEVIAYIGQEVSAGLDYAHKKTDSRGRHLQIVHRDVSPQNILCSYTGEIKIVDFGIAKAAMRGQQTAAGVIKGKYYYMSPEQALGERLDPRSDVFSTGILLYEMLVGQMLYLEDDMDKLIDKVRRAAIPSPTGKRKGIPRELEEIVMKALKRRADDRFGSSAEMGAALSDFLRRHAPEMGPPKLGAFLHTVMGADPTAKRGKKPPSLGPTKRPSMSDEFARDGNSLIFRLQEARKPAGPRGRDQATSPVSLPDVARGGGLDFDDNEATIVDSGGDTLRAGFGVGKSVKHEPEDDDDGEEESTRVESGRRQPKPLLRSLPDELFDSASFDEDGDESGASTKERLRSTIELRRKPKPPPPPGQAREQTDESEVTIDAPPIPANSPDSGPSGRPTPPPPATPSAAATLNMPATMNPFMFQQIDSEDATVTPVMAASPANAPTAPSATPSTPVSLPPAREKSQPFAIPPLLPAPKSRSRGLLVGLCLAALLAAGGAIALVLRHHQAGRTIEVVSLPPGAEVRIDGKVLGGTTPLEILDIDPSTAHEIGVALAGYQPWTQEVRFDPEQAQLQLRIQAVLVSLPRPNPPSNPTGKKPGAGKTRSP